ncbi:MAG: type II/IV secretion system ATPase subunit [Candidatus Nanohaloarchaea archaeon]
MSDEDSDPKSVVAQKRQEFLEEEAEPVNESSEGDKDESSSDEIETNFGAEESLEGSEAVQNDSEKDENDVPDVDELEDVDTESLDPEKASEIKEEYDEDEDEFFTEIEEDYKVESDGVPARITIGERRGEYVKVYKLDRPQVSGGTGAFVQNLRSQAVRSVKLSREEFTDADEVGKVKEKFKKAIRAQLEQMIPQADENVIEILVGNLIHQMVGLGDLEILLEDPHLEEMVVNSADEPTWVYHQDYGWLKSNIAFEDENEIYNYSSEIARRVGKNITSLDPLLDAHLPTGDRTNATLSPISTHGNTITIRKFARDPWTITDFIDNGTISKEVAAFLWLCLQYEMSVLVSGGTGSGKTSLLNVLMPFLPPNQRVISIEDTREVQLPDFLHWVPLTTRQANPEGEGEISMLDLLVNSLRMRPDRILVGEVRKKRQAEILFEAMHTGHSVYSTLHADTAEQTVQRLINPPINVAEQMVQSVDVNVVMFRDRRRNFRRVFEVAEISKSGYKRGSQSTSLGANVIYGWDSDTDEIEKKRESDNIMDKLKMHTGMDREEIYENIEDKEKVLQWMIDRGVTDVNEVGMLIGEYYSDSEEIIEMAENGDDPQEIFDRYS